MCIILTWWQKKSWEISDIEQAKKDGEDLNTKFWYNNKAVECYKHEVGFAILE